jgi:SH3-like domain-containing protein
MRSAFRSLAFVFVLALLSVGLAHAQTGVARGNVPLLELPSDGARVVAGLDSGETLVVQRVWGKWVRVRAGSRQGWVRVSRVAFGHSKSRELSLAQAEPVQHRRRRFVGGGRGHRRTRSGATRFVADSPAEAFPTTLPTQVPLDAPIAPLAAVPASAPKSEEPPRPSPSQRAARWRAGGTPAVAAPLEGQPTVADSKDAEAARETPAAPLSAAGGQRVAALARTPLLRSPSAGASRVVTARQGDTLQVVGKSGSWLLVEAGGERGWVERSRVRGVGDEDAALAAQRATVEPAGPEVAAVPQGGRFALRAQTGYVALSQSFDSDNGQPMGRYHLSSAAAAIAIGGQVAYMRGIWEVAGDLGYRLALAAPGVEVSAMGQRQDLSLTMHTFELGGRAGYRSPGEIGTGVYARLAYHVDAIQIDRSMLVPLPSENVSGLTVGVGLDIPRVSERLGARASIDLLPSGSREQTKGLGDGAEDNTVGLLLALGGGYRLGSNWSLEGGYLLSFLSTAYRGASPRLGMQGTWGLRQNTDHLFLIGVGYSR